MSKAPPEPWLPAAFGLADATAIRALSTGTATADQQRRALAWIINDGAATYQPSYRPNDRDTAFAEGRRAVGLRLVTIINLPGDILAKMTETKNVGIA